MRKARKEAFKSSSAVVKLQEELKAARNTHRVTQSTLDAERRKIQQRDQQTFDAQYKLVAVEEQLEKLQAQLQIVEEEREAQSPLSAHEETENEGDTDDAMDDAPEPEQDAAASKRPLKRSGTGSSIINPQFARLSISGHAGACRPNVGEVQERFSTLRLAA